MLNPEYSITYHNRVALNTDAVHTGVLVQSSPSMLNHLPKQDHTLLLWFDPEHAEDFTDHRGWDDRIELITSDDDLQMGRIYQLSPKKKRY
jgi:hypothetical protein